MNGSPMHAPAALPQDQFIRVRDLIEQRCGIHLDETRKESLHASLRARMAQLGIGQVEQYYDRLLADPADDEFRRLVNLVTVTETCFFRDPAQFEILRRRILPPLIAERSAEDRRTIRMWSAGCATGEEPYSIALVLRTMGLDVTYPDWIFEIVATDVNTDALNAASRGVYSPRSIRYVDGTWLRRYFESDGKQYVLSDEVKRSVRFCYSNLVQAPFPPAELRGQDVIFCKNVTIYFRPEVTRRLMRGLFEALNEGGYLFLGHSESLWHLSDDFRLVEYDGTFCYRKVTAPPALEARPQPRRSHPAPTPSLKKSEESSAPGTTGVPRRQPAPPAPLLTDTGSQYSECLDAIRARAWDGAEASLRALTQSSPTFIPAYLLLGGLYANQGRYEEALDQAARALGVDLFEAKAHLLVGMIEARRGRQKEALESLRRALYLDDTLALAHFSLANLYRDQGDGERATREYRNVIRSHQRQTLQMPEEFATDLTLGQLLGFCRRSLQALKRP